MAEARRKAVVLGLDGATFDVLLPRVERGQMPNLAALLQQSAWGELQSTTPPFSAQAWVSMTTGKNPARHGVVDFWEPSPDHMRRSFVSARQIRGETLAQIASRHGLRVGQINVPVTYPPQPVNGYLVSGFLTPQDSDDYVYPKGLRDEILALVPDYNPDPFDPLGADTRQIMELQEWMEKHERVSRHLVEREPTDLFFGVVQALDHLQHLFWNDIVDEHGSGRHTTLIDRCYARVDEIIAHRLALLDGQTTLFLVSDHGFGPVRKWFHVNRFLQERGWLVLCQPKGRMARLGLTPQTLRRWVRRLDVLRLRRWMGRMARVTLGRQIDESLTPPVDWSQTQAISGSPATEGIFVNLRGREPQGTVEPGEPYETLREQLMAELQALQDPETGEPVITAVYRREELYEGPFLEQLPDVVFDLGPRPYLASDALAAAQTLEPLPSDHLQGRHRATGIFVATGSGIHRTTPVKGARILDVAPTILYALDLPIPEDMDGRPLLEIFAEDYRASHPVRYTSAVETDPDTADQSLDEQDIAEMERRLRGLGYVS